MIDFAALDPETRCAALVGQFLKQWSAMEIELHEAIRVAMKLDDTMRAILCANVHLRDKIHILRTIISVSALDDTTKTYYKKKLENLGDFSLHRNMMAHDTFNPDDSGDGVVFSPVKSKGKSFLTEGDLVD